MELCNAISQLIFQLLVSSNKLFTRQRSSSNRSWRDECYWDICWDICWNICRNASLCNSACQSAIFHNGGLLGNRSWGYSWNHSFDCRSTGALLDTLDDLAIGLSFALL